MGTPNHVQPSKHIPHPHRSSPSPYPRSTRAYRKKDYEYLSNFPRMTAFLRVTHNDAELLQAKSDCNSSDLSMTASTLGYTTSISSPSSTSSSQTYGKELITSVDSDGHHHHQHMFLSTQSSADSPVDSTNLTANAKQKADNKVEDMSHADVKNGNLDGAGDCSGPVQEGSIQVKAQKRIQTKSKSRPHNTPAMLPKFGSWDTKNPSSGDSYTLIFRRLKDEKESGGRPMCTSPMHSDEEEAVQSGGQPMCAPQGSKAKEVLHAKSSSRHKGSGLSRRKEFHIPKRTARWNFCCKALVVDE